MSNLGTSLSKLLLRWRFPGFEQFTSFYKVPANARIVIFGAHNHLFDQLIQKHFDKHTRVNLESLATQSSSEEGLVDVVAKTVSTVDGSFSQGFFIQDFPRNPTQAARLDSLLGGVNLAINFVVPEEVAKGLAGKYLECVTCGKLYNNYIESTLPQQPGTLEKCNTPTKCNLIESGKDFNSQVAEYNQRFAPVLDYYHKRGLLLNFIVEPKWSYLEAQKNLFEEILAAIKL